MWALALRVTQISHKLYYDLLTSAGGRDLIMFWENHSHENLDSQPFLVPGTHDSYTTIYGEDTTEESPRYFLVPFLTHALVM